MDKDLTKEERHEILRKEFWSKIYVAYVSSDNSINNDGAFKWADIALQRFDERFSLKDKE
jgi:lysozyme family protein